MQINGQNSNPQVQYNSNYGCGNCSPVCAQTIPTQPAQNPNNPPPPNNNSYYYPQTTYQVPPNTSGVNIQIFNPSVTPPGAQAPVYNVNSPCYPANYYTGQYGPCCCNGGNVNGPNGGNVNGPNGGNGGTNGADSSSSSSTSNTTTNTEQKTEKKEVVMLTDEYIKSLENYLNSQNIQDRVNAAKQVYARLKEDKSRRDDKALTALVNKMLQDPSNEVRMVALAALDSRICTGDDFSVKLLQNMQQSNSGFGQDAVDASSILLKMAGQTVAKEVPVDESKKTETKTETKTESSSKKS